MTFISTLIVSKNNSKTIEKAIFSVLNQNLPSNVKNEVLVLDDNSDDGQKEILKKIEAKKTPNLRIFYSDKSIGLGKGRNYLIEKSKGSILFFLDGDAYATKDWIKKTLPLFNEKNVGVVTSLVLFEKRKDVVNGLGGVANFSFFAQDKFFEEYVYFIPKTPFYTLYGMGNGLVVRKEIFDKIGKFKEDELSYDDFDLCCRTWLEGYMIVANPQGVVYHETTSIVKHTNKRKYYDVLERLKMFLKYGPIKLFPKFVWNEIKQFKTYDIGFKIIYLKALLSIIISIFDVWKKRIGLRNKKNRYFIFKKLDNFFGSYKYNFFDFRKKLYNLSFRLDKNSPFYFCEKIKFNKDFLEIEGSAKLTFLKHCIFKKIVFEIENNKCFNGEKINIVLNFKNKIYSFDYFLNKIINIDLPKDLINCKGYIDVYFHVTNQLLIKDIYFS